MSVDNPEDAFRRALSDANDYYLDDEIAIAVSGGGDSIALMHLAARVIERRLIDVITIDHGLRPEAQDEIALVAKQARDLGLRHTVLNWRWDGHGNLQAAARDGRFDLIATHARTEGCDAVFLGHTEDDQVETFLMRLARGSGVDGLAAMSPATMRDGMQVIRPLLGLSRRALRDWLDEQGISWCDDPSNEDATFDRVRVRQMMDDLSALGLTRGRILQSVDHMQAARLSLQAVAQDFARAHVKQDQGDLIFDLTATDLTSNDTPRRVMAAGLVWVAGRRHRPRFARMTEIVERVTSGQVATFSGCVLIPEGDAIRITREASSTKMWIQPADYPADAQGVLWDGRWFVTGPLSPEFRIGALGDDIKHCPDWRNTGQTMMSLRSSPAVWHGDKLIAAPLAGLSNGWSAQIVADFHETAFAH